MGVSPGENAPISIVFDCRYTRIDARQKLPFFLSALRHGPWHSPKIQKVVQVIVAGERNRCPIVCPFEGL